MSHGCAEGCFRRWPSNQALDNYSAIAVWRLAGRSRYWDGVQTDRREGEGRKGVRKRLFERTGDGKAVGVGGLLERKEGCGGVLT